MAEAHLALQSERVTLGEIPLGRKKKPNPTLLSTAVLGEVGESICPST